MFKRNIYGFLLSCLVAAAATDQLGYSYQQIGQITPIGSSSGTIGNGVREQSIDIRYDGGTIPSVTNIFHSGSNGFDDSYGGISFSNGNTNGFNNPNPNSNGIEHNPENILFNKEFFTYAAAADDDDDGEFNVNGNSPQQLNGEKIVKNLRVIFIKAPENQGLTKAIAQLAKQASEDRTAIYVLSKQTDIGELANQLQTIKSTGGVNKPAVYFIKYRTSEEAANAQQLIKSQYDVLNGPSRGSYEGIAPVLNFISKGANNGNVDAAGTVNGFRGNFNRFESNGSGSGSRSGSGSYLPPIRSQ